MAADIINRPRTLEVNKTADIVAWDGDITQDKEAINKNVFVMKEGNIYRICVWVNLFTLAFFFEYSLSNPFSCI